MCGICGVYGQVERALLQRMRDTMVHRGPDDAGLYVDEQVGLGARRLSIIDLAGGHQPILNEDGSLCIVCNGEIYNFQELRLALEEKGYCFSTNSDTEVILHLYEAYGDACVHLLRGMFAFALWDVKKRCLFLARDRLGKKPLLAGQWQGRLRLGN